MATIHNVAPNISLLMHLPLAATLLNNPIAAARVHHSPDPNMTILNPPQTLLPSGLVATINLIHRSLLARNTYEVYRTSPHLVKLIYGIYRNKRDNETLHARHPHLPDPQ